MIIPLDSAYLCIDCNGIGDSAVSCPRCTSTALLTLATVLAERAKPTAVNEEPVVALLREVPLAKG